MSVESNDNLTSHDENGKFAEGNKLGKGRKEGSRNFTTKVREALSKLSEDGEHTQEEMLIKTVMEKAIIAKDTKMITLIWNYLDGKPAQSIDMTSMGKSINPLAELTDEELEEEYARLKRENNTGGKDTKGEG